MNKNKVVTRLESYNVNKAAGDYSHITKIEPNSTLYTFSGQIGSNLDGSLPDKFNQQVDNTFLNISRLLKSIDLTPDDIIKVNIWATEEIDWTYFYKVYNDFFARPYPSMTVAYVAALGLEEIKLEIEIWAAK